MFNIAIINNSDIGSEEYNSNKLLNVLIVRAGFPSSSGKNKITWQFGLLYLIKHTRFKVCSETFLVDTINHGVSCH